EWPARHTYYKHIGLYAFKSDVLKAVTELPQAPLEKAESLEQLRWLSAGYRIKVGVTDVETIGIDTPDDLAAAEVFLKEHSI
ncbi:MAG: 3-deoxy-manno-octulosonate cytidylyltransferase, partial [Bacteroidaceae bacterium]|nr:3-deoxy-manno-octulosonate cytidylyltransferase [Bacteroidaceae bacterium]